MCARHAPQPTGPNTGSGPIAFMTVLRVRRPARRTRPQQRTLSNEVNRQAPTGMHCSALHDRVSGHRPVLPSAVGDVVRWLHRVIGLKRTETPFELTEAARMQCLFRGPGQIETRLAAADRRSQWRGSGPPAHLIASGRTVSCRLRARKRQPPAGGTAGCAETSTVRALGSARSRVRQ